VFARQAKVANSLPWITDSYDGEFSFGNGYGDHYYAGVMLAVATPVAEFINRRPTVKVLVLSFLLQEWRSGPLNQRGAGYDCWLRGH
jgi:hypothetical protein